VQLVLSSRGATKVRQTSGATSDHHVIRKGNQNNNGEHSSKRNCWMPAAITCEFTFMKPRVVAAIGARYERCRWESGCEPYRHLMTRNAKPARTSRTGLAWHALPALLGRHRMSSNCSACTDATRFTCSACVSRTRLGWRHDLYRMDHANPCTLATGAFLGLQRNPDR
jgi:hypothetical protein